MVNYRDLIERSLERFRRAMVTERRLAGETKLVNCFEKRGLVPELLEEDSSFDIARVCREADVRNPYHTPGAPRGRTTHRRSADFVIWLEDRLTTYGVSITDPAFAPDVLTEFKAYSGDRTKLWRLTRGFEEDREKVRLACEQSAGLCGMDRRARLSS